MLFNSIDFAIFLPIVFMLYWFGCNGKIKLQNALIVAGSYVFYGWWDWRFLSLIIFSTFIDFTIGLRLQKATKKSVRKALLWSSILVNLGFLGFFKYFNFFVENFISAFSFFGHNLDGYSLNILLPVGISFYTFQTLSYTIDVYKKKLDATSDIIAFAAFVGFFPQLVAGPIERASNLLPQFNKQRNFNYLQAVDGLRQMLWGLFKKIVIADNCAHYADLVFNEPSAFSSSALVLGAVLFAFQIYGDFSGYSDIAIGCSKLFGVRLMQNFAFPYFSRDIAEFWRRWHISLSTWFRDYLYIPLGGSRGGTFMKVRNTFIIFIVSGFWHGANWTFIVWGALNALYFLPLLLANKNRKHLDIIAKGISIPSIRQIGNVLLTFTITVFAWIFFRAENIGHALTYISGIFSDNFFVLPNLINIELLFLLSVFLFVEWIGRENQYALEKIGLSWKSPYRLTFYYAIIFCIFWFSGEEKAFIYFQF